MSRIQSRAILAHICLVGATFKPGQEEELAEVITPEQVAHLRSTDPPAISGDWSPAVPLQLVPPDAPPAAPVEPPAPEAGNDAPPAPDAPAGESAPTPPAEETPPAESQGNDAPVGEQGTPAQSAATSAAPAPAPKAKGKKGA